MLERESRDNYATLFDGYSRSFVMLLAVPLLVLLSDPEDGGGTLLGNSMNIY
jgi:hypothetical protein